MDIRRELMNEIKLGNHTSKEKEMRNTIDTFTKEIDNLIEEMQSYFNELDNKLIN